MSSLSRWLAVVLAVIGPLAILAVAASRLSAEDEYQPSEAALRFDAMLAAAPPDIVVLGNSVAGTAIDESAFGRLLGTPAPVVAMMHVPLSRQPTWYAILANRVYRPGYHPKLVIVLDHLESMLETQSPSEEGRRELLGQMSEQDTLILRKTFDQEDATPAARRMRRGRAEARAWMVDHLKWASVGLVWAPPGPAPLTERGAAVADAALAKVFGDGTQVDFDLHARVLPVVELAEHTVATRTVSSRTEERTYLADIVRMVRENHGNILFIRCPAPPSNWWANRTDVETETRLVTELNDLGAGYLDLSGLPLRESDFTDLVHFSGTGRRQMTLAIARAVTEMHALEASRLPRTITPVRLRKSVRTGPVPPPTPVTRIVERKSGPCPYATVDPEWMFLATPTLGSVDARLSSPMLLLEDGEPLTRATHPKQNATCASAAYHGPRGMAFTPRAGTPTPDRYAMQLSEEFPVTSDQGLATWWVYPATEATFELAPPGDWSGGELTVTVWADLFGDGPALPSLVLDDGEPVSFDVAAGLARGTVTARAGARGWTVRVTSPADGRYVAIRSLSVRSGDQTRWVIGGASLEGGVARRIIGAQNPDLILDYALAAPEFDAVARLDPSGTGSFDAAPWRELSPGLLFARFALAQCSPFRVMEGDALLPGVPWECEDMATTPGALCSDGQSLHFRPTRTPADPADYRLVADPTRDCNKGSWVYPGDTVTVTARNLRFRIGPDRLVVAAIPATPDPGNAAARVRLRAGGRDLVDEQVPLSEFAKGDVVWDLNHRIAPDGSPVVLQIGTAPGAPFVALTVAVLMEGDPFAVRDGERPATHRVAATSPFMGTPP